MLLENMKADISCNRFGGNGDVIIEHYIDEKMLNDTVVMYAKVTLKPGCSLGYHVHTGNSETIVVLQGTADYNDNGTPMTLHAGDRVHYMAKDMPLAIPKMLARICFCKRW